MRGYKNNAAQILDDKAAKVSKKETSNNSKINIIFNIENAQKLVSVV